MPERTLVSMKRPRRKDGTPEVAMPGSSSEPEYGYGLTVRLENFELDALKVKMQSVALGQELDLQAKVKVVRMSESKSMQNKGDRNIELQITKMALGKGTKDSAAGEKGSRATAGESL
jgi:hypothetical protein